MAGTLYEALIDINVQDNDAPAQLGQIISRLEAEMQRLGSLPEVDLGTKVMGSLGSGIGDAEAGLQKLAAMMEALRANMDTLGAVDPMSRSMDQSRAISQLQTMSTLVTELITKVGELSALGGRVQVTPEQLVQRQQDALAYEARAAETPAAVTPQREAEIAALAAANPVVSERKPAIDQLAQGLANAGKTAEQINASLRKMNYSVEQADAATLKAAGEIGRAVESAVDLSHVDPDASTAIQQAQLKEAQLKRDRNELIAKGNASEEEILAATLAAQKASEERFAAQGREEQKYKPDLAGQPARLDAQRKVEEVDPLEALAARKSAAQANFDIVANKTFTTSQEDADKAIDNAKKELLNSIKAYNAEVLRQAKAAEVQSQPDLKFVDPSASTKIQQLQVQEAEARAKLLDLLGQSNATEAQILKAELRVEQTTSAVATAREKEAAAAAGGGSGSGFGRYGRGSSGGGGGGLLSELGDSASSLFKYYAIYQAFSFGQKLLVDTKKATEDYSLAVNQLTIAMGGNGAAAAEMAQQYAAIGTSLATSPSTAINAATQFTRAYQDQSGSAGLVGAQLGSTMQLLESTGNPEADTQANQKRLSDIIALTKNYGTGVEGASSAYDQATVIAQLYGGQKGGDLLSGTAQIADLLKGSGFSQEQGLALVGSVMQSTGDNSDAAAGDLKRFLGRQGQASFTDIFSKYGIGQNQTLEQQLQQFAPIFQGLDSSQQEGIIGKLGGGRAGAAVQAVLENYKELNDNAKKAADSVGAAQDQANDKLKTFAGLMDKLRADMTALGTDIGQSGIGEVFGAALATLDPLLTGVDDLLKAFNRFPSAIKDIIAALVLLKAAAAFTGGGGITGLLERAGGTAAASAEGSAVGSAAPGFFARLKPGVPLFGGAAAATEAETATGLMAVGESAATSISPLAGIASTVAGLGTAAASAAVALAPVAAILAGFALYGAASSSKDAFQATADDVTGKAMTDAKKKAVADRNINALNSISEKERADAKAMDDNAHSLSGSLLLTGGDLAGSFLPGRGLTSASDAETVASKAIRADAARYAKQAADIAAQNKASNAAAAAGAGAAGIFDALPSGGFGNIPGGLDSLKSQRVPLAKAADDLNALFAKSYGQGVDALEKLFNPAQGDQGLEQEIARQTKLANAERDPGAQLADLGKIMQETQNALSLANSSGDADKIDQAQTLVDTASKAYFDLLLRNTKAKIASIKALEGNDAKADSEIQSTVRSSLNEALKAGNVDATIQLLAGVDKAFVQAEAKMLNAQKMVLQNTLRALEDVASMGMQAEAAVANARDARAEQALTGSTTGSTTITGRDAALAAQNEQRVRAAQAAVNQINTMVNTFNTALPYAAPTGLDFKDPKVPKEKKPTGPTAAQIEEARLAAQEIPGDPLSAAATNLAVARYKMSEPKNAEQYWQAVKALHQAQYDYAKAELDQTNNADLLRIDNTDPLAQAREKVRAAQRLLAFDTNRGALSDVTTADKVQLRQAQSDAEKQAFDQKFSDEKTNYDLQRQSLGAYLSYLNAQHDYLTAVHNKSRQQIDELNQVDSALKSLADQMQGQFNLGAIKMPSVYEVRRAVVAGAANNVTTNNVRISISGADIPAVKAVIAQYVGQAAMQTVGSTGRKV